MPGINELEYRQKAFEFEDEFIRKFYSENTSENEKMILVLQHLDWDIRPYSLNWRSGYKKYIKKAIKMLKEVIEDEKISRSVK